ncbi:aldolase/citrate lyase family protein [Agathobaculum sp. NTUH-O15-33]|uniref:HpcH/HpaI aldolase family protein n=1 Tax=Agathobaculum sp. NTUH-O15-33 TaxID=3079302 RepID=UPI0029587D5E|nr:aldolase/citrate lyase family protein [Agathobaculum sp. NTUH-O15-33]WNX84231.1 aldolase/citrate lyase family protein [Agathobaculum sp. NTUH-O15-33]
MLRLDETFHNPVKQLLKENKKVLGAWLQMASPYAAEIFAKAGVDVLMVDMEHAPNDPLTLLEQLRAMGRFDAVPFARAPWNDLVTIKRMLDVGLYGLLIPYVNTKQEAENAVRACKYPPQGMRGIAPSPRAGGFGMNAQNYLAHANDEIVVMTAVETGAAVENLDEILEVDGLDGIFIGPMDLATSMGHFCDPSAPEVQQAIRTIEQKVFASGKFLATVAGSFDKAKDLYDKGYSMVVAFADGGTLGRVAREQVDRFHAAYPDR